MGKYLEVLNEIKAEFGDNWIFPAAGLKSELAEVQRRGRAAEKELDDEGVK